MNSEERKDKNWVTGRRIGKFSQEDIVMAYKRVKQE
jgi:hypothetical protein